MKLGAPLVTERLRLRTLSDGDVDERYLGWMRDLQVTRYLEARLGEHTLESLAQFVESCNASADQLLLGICLADGRHIGNIKLGPIDPYHRHAAVGLLIGDKDRWGNGYAAEAIAGLTTHAFVSLGLEKLYAGAYAANVGSIRAFLKVGWIEEGRSKDHWRSDDTREDDVRLGITRMDWSAALG